MRRKDLELIVTNSLKTEAILNPTKNDHFKSTQSCNLRNNEDKVVKDDEINTPSSVIDSDVSRKLHLIHARTYLNFFSLLPESEDLAFTHNYNHDSNQCRYDPASTSKLDPKNDNNVFNLRYKTLIKEDENESEQMWNIFHEIYEENEKYSKVEHKHDTVEDILQYRMKCSISIHDVFQWQRLQAAKQSGLISYDDIWTLIREVKADIPIILPNGILSHDMYRLSFPQFVKFVKLILIHIDEVRRTPPKIKGRILEVSDQHAKIIVESSKPCLVTVVASVEQTNKFNILSHFQKKEEETKPYVQVALDHTKQLVQLSQLNPGRFYHVYFRGEYELQEFDQIQKIYSREEDIISSSITLQTLSAPEPKFYLAWEAMREDDQFLELNAIIKDKAITHQAMKAGVIISKSWKFQSGIPFTPEQETFLEWWKGNDVARDEFCTREVKHASRDAATREAAKLHGIEVAPGYWNSTDLKKRRCWKEFCWWYFGKSFHDSKSVRRNKNTVGMRIDTVSSTPNVTKEEVASITNFDFGLSPNMNYCDLEKPSFGVKKQKNHFYFRYYTQTMKDASRDQSLFNDICIDLVNLNNPLGCDHDVNRNILYDQKPCLHDESETLNPIIHEYVQSIFKTASDHIMKLKMPNSNGLRNTEDVPNKIIDEFIDEIFTNATNSIIDRNQIDMNHAGHMRDDIRKYALCMTDKSITFNEPNEIIVNEPNSNISRFNRCLSKLRYRELFLRSRIQEASEALVKAQALYISQHQNIENEITSTQNDKIPPPQKLKMSPTATCKDKVTLDDTFGIDLFEPLGHKKARNSPEIARKTTKKYESAYKQIKPKLKKKIKEETVKPQKYVSAVNGKREYEKKIMRKVFRDLRFWNGKMKDWLQMISTNMLTKRVFNSWKENTVSNKVEEGIETIAVITNDDDVTEDIPVKNDDLKDDESENELNMILLENSIMEWEDFRSRYLRDLRKKEAKNEIVEPKNELKPKVDVDAFLKGLNLQRIIDCCPDYWDIYATDFPKAHIWKTISTNTNNSIKNVSDYDDVSSISDSDSEWSVDIDEEELKHEVKDMFSTLRYEVRRDSTQFKNDPKCPSSSGDLTSTSLQSIQMINQTVKASSSSIEKEIIDSSLEDCIQNTRSIMERPFVKLIRKSLVRRRKKRGGSRKLPRIPIDDNYENDESTTTATVTVTSQSTKKVVDTFTPNHLCHSSVTRTVRRGKQYKVKPCIQTYKTKQIVDNIPILHDKNYKGNHNNHNVEALFSNYHDDYEIKYILNTKYKNHKRGYTNHVNGQRLPKSNISYDEDITIKLPNIVDVDRRDQKRYSNKYYLKREQQVPSQPQEEEEHDDEDSMNHRWTCYTTKRFGPDHALEGQSIYKNIQYNNNFHLKKRNCCIEQ